MSEYPGSSTQATPSSSMALISMISGILGITLLPIVGSIVALIVGYMAKKEIRESTIPMEGSGMATAGIVMGWVGVGLAVTICCVIGAFFLFLIPLGISIGEYGSLLPFIKILF